MIDWFTVMAQIVNFLILVGLLKYFLYGRIIAAMEEREQQIAGRWNEAEQSKQQAAQEAEELRNQNREFDERRGRLMARVRKEVASERRQLAAAVRAEIDATQARWMETIRQETESFLQDLRQRASEEVWLIARRVLADLATEDIERQIVVTLLDRLERMNVDKRQDIVAVIRHASGSIVVRSAWQLPDDLRQQLTAALEGSFASDIDVRFETSPDLVCGIEIHADNHKLAWEMKNYLDLLETQMARAIEEEVAVATKQITQNSTPELAKVR